MTVAEKERIAGYAVLGDCRAYRYSLWRIWDEALPTFIVIGLNPSTADETKDDPTISLLTERGRSRTDG